MKPSTSLRSRGFPTARSSALETRGADGIDLNLGCPQRRAREGRALAALVSRMRMVDCSGNIMGYNGIVTDFMGYSGILADFMGYNGIITDFMGYNGIFIHGIIMQFDAITIDLRGLSWIP